MRWTLIASLVLFSNGCPKCSLISYFKERKAALCLPDYYSFLLNCHELRNDSDWLRAEAQKITSREDSELFVPIGLKGQRYSMETVITIQVAETGQLGIGTTTLWFWKGVPTSNRLQRVRPRKGGFLMLRNLDTQLHPNFTITGLELTFKNPDLNCVAGVYIVQLCPADDTICVNVSFSLKTGNKLEPCRVLDETFVEVSSTIPDYLKQSFNLHYHSSPVSKFSNEQSPEPSLTLKLAGIFTGSFLAAFFITLLCCYYRHRTNKKQCENRNNEGEAADSLIWESNDTYVTLTGNRKNSQNKIWAVSMTKLDRVSLLGEGNFGRVYLVTWNSNESPSKKDIPEKLAMKQLKFLSKDRLGELEKEANVLATLDHDSIVKFYGVSFESKEFSVGLLFEYMENGALVDYLRLHNSSTGQPPLLSYSDLFGLAEDVVKGVEYLALRNLVHRDLAARNCLLDTTLRVKISDFGMARNLYSTDYYKMGNSGMVPLRWLPPETALYRKFTLESDIWGLGVLLWEIFSFGQVPWCAYSNCEVLDLVKEGRKLERSESCPVDVYENLLLPCWEFNPGDRIGASEARVKITKLQKDINCYVAVVAVVEPCLEELPTSRKTSQPVPSDYVEHSPLINTV